MAVVKKGYAYLGYAALITLFIPFVIHAVATKGKEIWSDVWAQETWQQLGETKRGNDIWNEFCI